MKKFHGANQFAKAISTAADKIGERVIERFRDRDTKGREEDISSQLAGELTGHLIEEVAEQVKDIQVPGIDFDAVVYKKKTENKVGADLAGSVIYKAGDQSHAKVFLVQAKVATSASRIDLHNIELKAGDYRLLKQCKDMLAITPAAFVFIYSEFGVHVVPAASVVRSGRSSVDTKEHYYRELGSFYEEVYKCFTGDLSLGDSYRDEKRMKELCDELKAQRGLAITAKTKGLTRRRS